jgi:glycosyltransferase involved in cell wall biosynthesis
MIKVTFCAYDKPDNVGGPVSWIRRLAPLLRERGVEVRCLFIMHWGDEGPAITPLREAGFECPSTNLELTEDRIRWILDDVAAHTPDVFVPNLVVAGYYAGRWIREAGIPTVGVLHSDDAFYHAILDEFVFGREANRVSSVVAVSQKLEDDVTSRHPRSTSVHRIPYGVSIPNARVTRSGAGLRLAYVGRLAEEQKRISEVVHAMGQAVREVPATSAVIYGDGPDRQAVERLLNSEYADADIVLGGLVDSEQIQDRMLQSDVIVLLSDYEGLPIALLEAMACGCVPICLAGESGISELILDGMDGLIVRDRGAAFVDAIRRLSANPNLWSKLSHGARARAESFSAAASADAWATLLKEFGSRAANPGGTTFPRKLQLTPVNPHLASADVRADPPRPLSNFFKRARMLIGRWRRRLASRQR